MNNKNFLNDTLLMKKGKFISVGTHDNVKIGYGTVDHINLKTIYIQLSSWVEPNVDDIDFNKKILKSRREIKEKVKNLNVNFFKQESIVDLDIKTSGIKKNKRSFMDLEITLFVNNQVDIKSSIVKNTISDLSKSIIDTALNDKELYNFFEKKN